MAVEKATQEDREDLRRIYDDFCLLCSTDTLDMMEVCEKEFELHKKRVEISKSPKFIKIYEQISNQLRSYIKITHHDYDLSQSGVSHFGIVDAIIDGDANRAWSESKQNITVFTKLCHNQETAEL